MMFDDDDFEFDGDGQEAEDEMREKTRQVNCHPLMIQAKEILQIVDSLLETCEEQQDTGMYGSTLRESAMVVIAKLSSALSSDNYFVCMQNAAIIRDHAEYLRLSNHFLEMPGGFDERYVNMFRQEMEIFRGLFRTWAKQLGSMARDVEDEWGLF